MAVQLAVRYHLIIYPRWSEAPRRRLISIDENEKQTPPEKKPPICGPFHGTVMTHCIIYTQHAEVLIAVSHTHTRAPRARTAT